MTAPRAPRKDAARNRARLVAAAASAFREEGLGASVNAIARDAGVNVATLYRHFPTKDELVTAVLQEVLTPMKVARDEALARDDDAVLATFLHEAVRLQGEHKGLIDALSREPSGPNVREALRGPALEIVTPVVERAHRSGELRADFEARDLLIALGMLAALAGAATVTPEEARRHVDVVLRGLRPSP
jgi:AcrR family transcriptional regulator